MRENETLCTGDSKTDTRHAQILSAATFCFCKHGFHGASIAMISKAACMSAGHIYHYFANKEAIIAAIVEQDRQEVLIMVDRFREQDDIIEAMLAHAESGIDRALDPDRATLHVEILAEATRNSNIAAIIRNADAKIRDSMQQTLRCIPPLKHCPDEILYGIAEVICTMFSGLMSRSICNPGLQKTQVINLFRKIISDLLNNNPDRIMS